MGSHIIAEGIKGEPATDSRHPVILGVISDTHIPDRVRHLHPQVIPRFRAAGVKAILHAGDVSSPDVLRQLSQVAPVHAVRGNRDWLLLPRLPLSSVLNFGGVTIALTHGHGRWWNYFIDRVYFILQGYRLQRFQPRLQASFPEAQVIAFGHTHHTLNHWLNGQLLFNPGSPHCPDDKIDAPSIGLLSINAGGDVNGDIIELDPE
jgi:putative phosphoesterase